MKGTQILLLMLWSVNMILTTQTTDLKQLKRRIEEERQVEKIKNEIIRKLDINVTSLLRPSSGSDFDSPNGHHHRPTANSKEHGSHQSQGSFVQERADVIILGEPTSRKKDGCLQFPMTKHTSEQKQFNGIRPMSVNLWVHVRKRRKSRKDKKMKGRRIKIYVTNGTKTLARIRMRVEKTDWQKIELPVSHFPDEVKLDHTFKLCLECKKCNKKYKIDLYKKRKPPKKRVKNPPNVPFIYIEARSDDRHMFSSSSTRRRRHRSLHRVYARNDTNLEESTRDSRLLHESTVCQNSCCRLHSWTVDSAEISPHIVWPKTLQLNYCFDSCHHISTVAKDTSALSDDSQNLRSVCSPHSFKPIAILLNSTDTSTDLYQINNLAVKSCKCRFLRN